MGDDFFCVDSEHLTYDFGPKRTLKSPTRTNDTNDTNNTNNTQQYPAIPSDTNNIPNDTDAPHATRRIPSNTSISQTIHTQNTLPMTQLSAYSFGV